MNVFYNPRGHTGTLEKLGNSVHVIAHPQVLHIKLCSVLDGQVMFGDHNLFCVFQLQLIIQRSQRTVIAMLLGIVVFLFHYVNLLCL